MGWSQPPVSCSPKQPPINVSVCTHTLPTHDSHPTHTPCAHNTPHPTHPTHYTPHTTHTTLHTHNTHNTRSTHRTSSAGGARGEAGSTGEEYCDRCSAARSISSYLDTRNQHRPGDLVKSPLRSIGSHRFLEKESPLPAEPVRVSRSCVADEASWEM